MFKNLIPWTRDRGGDLSHVNNNANPVVRLHQQIDRAFDQFWDNFGAVPWRGFGRTPALDMTDTGKAVEVSVELPGWDEKNVDVTVQDDVLIIRGENSSESEDRKEDYYVSERSFGSFYRSVPLPFGTDGSKAEARFKKGVLTVTLPKTVEAQDPTRKIEIKAA